MSDRKTFVVNPDKQSQKHYAFMLRDDGNVTLLAENFSQEHVNLVVDRLEKE
jgi:hypothetical protein